MTFDDTRIIAYDLNLSVYQDRRPFDDAQARHQALARLDTRDRNFVRLLANTVFRRAGELDAIIQPMLRKRLRGKAAPVRYILWLGVAQLLFLKTPPHAAVIWRTRHTPLICQAPGIRPRWGGGRAHYIPPHRG